MRRETASCIPRHGPRHVHLNSHLNAVAVTVNSCHRCPRAGGEQDAPPMCRPGEELPLRPRGVYICHNIYLSVLIYLYTETYTEKSFLYAPAVFPMPPQPATPKTPTQTRTRGPLTPDPPAHGGMVPFYLPPGPGDRHAHHLVSHPRQKLQPKEHRDRRRAVIKKRRAPLWRRGLPACPTPRRPR